VLTLVLTPVLRTVFIPVLSFFQVNHCTKQAAADNVMTTLLHQCTLLSQKTRYWLC